MSDPGQLSQGAQESFGSHEEGADGGVSSDRRDTAPGPVTLLIVSYARPPPALPSFLPSSASSVSG